MQRLTIYLKYVKPEAGKIRNTLSFKIENPNQVRQLLALYDGNVKKHQISNIN